MAVAFVKDMQELKKRLAKRQRDDKQERNVRFKLHGKIVKPNESE